MSIWPAIPLVLLCLLVRAQSGEENQSVVREGVTLSLPLDEKVVNSWSTVENGNRRFRLLTTNLDAVIHLRSYSAPVGSETATMHGVSYLGYTTEATDALPINSGEVPIRRIRSTLPSGAVYTAIATMFYLPTEWGFGINLYVFRANESVVSRAFSQVQLGTNLKELHFRDVDGDGLPEMFCVSRTGNVEALNVWKVTASGVVEPSQKVGGAIVELQWIDPQLWVEVREREATQEYCFRVKFRGRWERQVRRFVEDVQQSVVGESNP